MQIRLASGLTMNYQDVGAGTPIVLLHAFPLDHTLWQPQIEVLQFGYRVITPDLRGFGATGGLDGRPGVERFADDISELLVALGIKEPVVLGGLSMGGYIALAFARKYPDRLRAMILADTKAEPDTAEGKANRDKSIAFVTGHTSVEFIETMLPKLLGKETMSGRPAVADLVRQMGAAQSTTGIVAGLQALRDRPDATATLPMINVPTLVVVGAEDTITPLSVAEVLAKGIRGARLQTIEKAGHLANLENPEAFNKAVRTFLADVGIGASAR